MAEAGAAVLALEVTGLRKVFPVRRARRSEMQPEAEAGPPTTRGHKDELVAVDDVSFSVPSGGSLAIVGESGSGKTTIARIIVGLERPTSGRVIVEGRERRWRRARSKDRRRAGRDVQIVFQDPYSSLDPHQRIGDCLDEVLRLHFSLSRERRSERVALLLDQVGLDDRHARSLPRALSGGQRQRVAIARSLASEPRILICDEAVASLDVSIQAQVLNLLADIRDQTGVTFLFISHDLAVVRQVSDDVIVMQRGRIVEQGRTGRVLDEPENAYTRALLAAIPRQGWHPTRTPDFAR